MSKKQEMFDLSKDQADYKRLFEESPIPMWIYNSISLKFINVNTAAIQYYGYSHEEFLHMQVPDLRAKGDETGATSEIVKVPALNSFYDSGRRMHIKKSGQKFYAQVYSHPTFFNGKIARVMLAMDINNKVLIEQKNAELNDLLRDQKARLDDILSSVSEVIWSARGDNFEILYINPACINVYGYSPGELIGDNYKLFGNVHPADTGIVKDSWDALLATGKAVFEYRIYHRDGSMKYIINQAVLKAQQYGPPVIHGIAVDVTRIRTAEEKLIEKVNDVESILESITDGFFAVDKNWNYAYINKEFEGILLRRREDLLGKNIWENFPYVENLKFYTEQHRAVAEHRSVHFDEYIPVLKRWFTVNAYPTKEGLTVYLRDITEERRQSIKIQTQHDKLRDIAWIQSHKVRGPLATILGLVDLFNTEDATDPSNKEIVENLREAAQTLDAVVKEIVDKTSLDI